MLYRGTQPGAFYRGAYKPGELRKGTQLVAGYKDVSKAAPASWDGTYDDFVGVAAQGRGKQDGTPTPSAPVPLVAAEGSLTASGRTGTTPTTVTLPVLRAIPGSDIRDELAYIGGGRWQVTRRVGVQELDQSANIRVTAQSNATLIRAGIPSNAPAQPFDGTLQQLIVASTHFHRPSHGLYINQIENGDIWYSDAGTEWRIGYGTAGETVTVNDFRAFLAEQAAAGDPVTTWYALATPTTETVTLGELPSYPVHTELAVSGDYPPDVTATVKVGI